MRTTRIAFSTLAFPDATLTSALELGRRWGYAGVELRLIDGELIDPSMPPADRDRVKRTIAAAGLPVVAVDSSIRLTDADRSPELRRFLELASDWESPLVRVFGGALASGPDRGSRREQLAAAARVLESSAGLAERLGVAIGVETHDAFSASSTVAELLALVDAPSVGAVWDSHHPYRMGEQPAEVYANLGSRVLLAQVKDARRFGPDADDWQLVLLGQGEVPVREMLGLLRSGGYRHWISVEWEKRWHPEIAEPEVALPQHLEVLVNWLEAMLLIRGFGIVGTGVIAEIHANAIAMLPQARLAAVTDVNAGAAAAFAAARGCAAEPDLDALLARADVDVVCVCVPSGLHAQIGTGAAKAGKHLVVEKPIDVALEAADRLIEAAAAAGVALTVISQHRFDSGLAELKRLLDTGALGRLVLGQASTKWYRSQAYYDSAAWRGSHAMDGGSLMNQGIHYVDLLRWCMGPVSEVTAVCATQAHRMEAEDTALAIVRFSSGAVGTILSSTAAFPGFPQRLEITGTEGTVIVEDGQIVRRAFRSCGEPDPAAASGPGAAAASGPDPAAASGPGAAADPVALDAAGHAAQIADLLTALDEGREPAVGGQDGRDALEIVCAVYESARSGRSITLRR